MAKILVFSEVTDAGVKPVTLEILSHLEGHTREVVALNDITDQGIDNLKVNGAENIHVLSGEGLDKYSPEGYGNALKDFIEKGSYDYVLAGTTSLAKDLFPRLSAKFNSAMASDLTNFKMDGDKLKGERPLFAGKVICNVELGGNAPFFATIRPNALGINDSVTAAAGNKNSEAANSGDIKAIIKEIIKGAGGRLDLTEANIIVSGGRGVKTKDNFKIIEEMADAIGASVGASRALVDAGEADHDIQVGQTGKTVAPTLYIACGISGAIQHLAGMRTSKYIVAINNDPDAPIFDFADYGIVGDLFKVVPEMTNVLKSM